jgi:hypothetical protein
MTIDEAARRIEEAVWAAYDAGFQLCDDDGMHIWRADLWEIRDGQATDSFASLSVPTVDLEHS